MYHSVTFGSMNSFSDWHLVPDGRPVVVLPEPKIVTVEVPGGNGLLDLSEALTRYPVYNVREGSISFRVLSDVEPYNKLYPKISNYLHGKQMAMVLEDDPSFYYYGRYKVEWVHNNDGTGSNINISYSLDPYKYCIETSLQEDPNLYEGITVSGNTVTKVLSGDRTIGEVPVVPEFIFSDVSESGITIQLTNSELDITNLSKTINSNGTRKYYDMILSNLTDSNTLRLDISGHGTVDVLFRRMSL